MRLEEEKDDKKRSKAGLGTHHRRLSSVDDAPHDHGMRNLEDFRMFRESTD